MDLNLGDEHSDVRGDGRDEAVELSVELDAFHNLAAKGLGRAAEVMKLDAGETGDQPVGRVRGQAARQEPVFPFPAPAVYDIVALGDFFQEARDVPGVVLQVGVQGDDDF